LLKDEVNNWGLDSEVGAMGKANIGKGNQFADLKEVTEEDKHCCLGMFSKCHRS
jgi:hypothetical protein